MHSVRNKASRGARSDIGMCGVALAGLLLTGCADAGPTETPWPSQSVIAVETEAVPVLTEEEALQIAVDTYEEYLVISGELIDSQGDSFADLEEMTTSNMHEANQDALEQAQSAVYSTEGHIPVMKAEILQFDDEEIEALLCLDLSQSGMWDENGQLVGPDRDGRTDQVKVGFVTVDGEFKIDGVYAWTQSDFCTD